MSKETTKLRGNFVTIEEIGAALFFAFMAGACATGLYFDFIEKVHPCDPVAVRATTPPLPAHGVMSPRPTDGGGLPLGHPPYRFRQFH